MSALDTRTTHSIEGETYLIVFDNDGYLENFNLDDFHKDVAQKVNKRATKISLNGNVIFLSFIIETQIEGLVIIKECLKNYTNTIKYKIIQLQSNN